MPDLPLLSDLRPAALRANPWQIAALMAFALVAPASLPAGAGDRRQPELRRRLAREPWLSTWSAALHCAPQQQAPTLTHLAPGEPLAVLRQWTSDSGVRWLQVQAPAGPGLVRRGWLVIS
jgi:hypothetical protein